MKFVVFSMNVAPFPEVLFLSLLVNSAEVRQKVKEAVNLTEHVKHLR